MRPVTIGIIVAAAIILAFVVGMQVEEEQEGPVEKMGEAIEDLSEQPPSQ